MGFTSRHEISDPNLISFKFDSNSDDMVTIYYDGKRLSMVEKSSILKYISKMLEDVCWYDENSAY